MALPKRRSCTRLLLLLLFFNTTAANCAALNGTFSNEEKYRASYKIKATKQPNAPATKLLTINVELASGQKLSYSYDAPDYPAVQSSPLGFISVIVNQGGMEGSRIYNYLFLSDNKLVSAGEVETFLHLGDIEDIEDIEIRKNNRIRKSSIRRLISSVAGRSAKEISNHENAYPNAMLCLLGKSYNEDMDIGAAGGLLENTEIKADPVLLARLKSSFCE
jgi:hypothetical protein